MGEFTFAIQVLQEFSRNIFSFTNTFPTLIFQMPKINNHISFQYLMVFHECFDRLLSPSLSCGHQSCLEFLVYNCQLFILKDYSLIFPLIVPLGLCLLVYHRLLPWDLGEFLDRWYGNGLRLKDWCCGHFL